jgi:hypothetical protein
MEKYYTPDQAEYADKYKRAFFRHFVDPKYTDLSYASG